jgi:signal transduction histidine kinase
MNNPPLPEDEEKRLAALMEYQILDTERETAFDDITSLASEICQTPISLITLIDSDRQWFKSGRGLDIRETPREFAFCNHALNLGGDILVVADSRSDVRFENNPLVTASPFIVFYTGVPLVNPEGHTMGTLCVIDQKPRTLSGSQISSLRTLAKQVVQLMELKKANRHLNRLKEDLESRNSELEQFAYVVSHDIKSPLASIVLTSEMLRENFGDAIDEGNDQLLKVLNRASLKIKNLADGILAYYHGERAISEQAETFDLKADVQSIVDILKVSQPAVIHFSQEEVSVRTNRTAFEQIIINLLQNALKYNDKEKAIIHIRFREDPSFYYFEVQDNGPGIAAEHQQKIFELFTTLGIHDRSGAIGTGIGLSTVKKLVEKQGGEMNVRSAPGEGAVFEFTLKKNR